MKIGVLKLVVLVIIITSCGSGDKKQISISGAFALYPLVVKWTEEYEKIHPNVVIDVQAGGAGKGIADALGGQTDLGMVSRDINEEEIKRGAWFIPVTKDAVLPTFNISNPYASEIVKKGIAKPVFKELWIEGKPLTWGEITGQTSKDPVKVYKRADASGAGESWAKYLGKKQDDLKGVGVSGDPGMIHAIKSDVLGIGFNNVIYVYDLSTKKTQKGIQVIPIDINENGIIDPDENFYSTLDDINKAIADGRYPSPPARDLYFISKGKPSDPVVLEFLSWILTDGQKYVKEACFIPLSQEELSEIKSKLK